MAQAYVEDRLMKKYAMRNYYQKNARAKKRAIRAGFPRTYTKPYGGNGRITARAILSSLRRRGRRTGTVRTRRFRGRGDYFGPLAAKWGGRLGSVAGQVIGGRLDKWTGLGDYAPNAEEIQCALNLGTSVTPATMGNAGQGGRVTTMRHREFIRNVVVPHTGAGGYGANGSGSFLKLFELRLQPGLPVDQAENEDAGVYEATKGGFANWLPEMAQRFEQWQPRGMIFEFKSNYSDNTNFVMGYVD